MSARERFDRKVNTLVPLQIMIAIEALRTLVTLERSIVVRLRLGRMRRAVHVLEVCCMAAVESSRHHAVWQAAEEHRLTVRIVDVGQHRAMGRIRRKRSLVVLRRLHRRG